jgi:formate hydrogenlyase subunit 3/multisubunit Na+/H+ antiporter MnhD subunit
MTFLIVTILFLFTLVTLTSNLYPKIQLKYPWILTCPIYLTGIISYVMLLWMILLHNRDFRLNAALPWIPFDLNPISLEFKIDNQTILLLTILSTVFILKQIFFKNRSKGIASAVILHQANFTNTLLLAGLTALVSDSLLITAVAQIIFSLALYYHYLELYQNAGKQSSGSIHYLWLIFFDLLFILAAMLIFAEEKLLTISTLSRLNFYGPNLSLLNQTARFLIILSLFGKAAQVPFHKWLIISSSRNKSTPEKSYSLESLIIIMSIFLKLHQLFGPDCRLFALVIGFIGTLLALSAAIINKSQVSIFNYLLIAQAGLFLIILGAGFDSLLLIYIITFSWSNLLLQFSINSRNRPSDKITGYFSITSIIIGILAIIGFPLTAGLGSKIIIFQNLISQVQLNPVCWLTLILFSPIYLLLIFNLFRLFFSWIHSDASSGSLNPVRLSLSQKSIITILVLLNFYFLYAIPDYSPFATRSWLDGFLPSPIQVHPDIAVNQFGVIGLLILFQLLSFLTTLLIYHFKVINTDRLRLTFRGIEKFIRFLIDPNPMVAQKLDLITNQIAARIHQFEYRLTDRFSNGIVTGISRTQNMFMQFNDRLIKADQSKQSAHRKSFSKLIQSFNNKELIFLVTALAVLILIIILSIL